MPNHFFDLYLSHLFSLKSTAFKQVHFQTFVGLSESLAELAMLEIVAFTKVGDARDTCVERSIPTYSEFLSVWWREVRPCSSTQSQCVIRLPPSLILEK